MKMTFCILMLGLLTLGAGCGQSAHDTAGRKPDSQGQPSAPVRASAVANAPAPAPEVEQVSLADDFKGKLGLKWEILNPDPSHYSLEKPPHHLTITTQPGRFRFGDTTYKNLFLTACPPPAPDTVLQVTVCLAGFRPEANYQQAGLVFWRDNGAYLKWDYEFSSQRRLVAITEPGRNPVLNYISFKPPADAPRLWLRVIQYDRRYYLESSTDGKGFKRHGFIEWSAGSVKKVGFYAQNVLAEAPGIEARFDSFQIERLPLPEEFERLDDDAIDRLIYPGERVQGNIANAFPPIPTSASLRGLVLTPDRKPAAGAEVLLWERPVDNATLLSAAGQGALTPWELYGKVARTATTNAEGKFRIPVTSPVFNILVRHVSGGALADEKFRRSGGTINLASWGRVEGVAMKGRTPLTNIRVEVCFSTPHDAPHQVPNRPPRMGSGSWDMVNFLREIPQECRYLALTDAQGRFVIDKIPAGASIVSKWEPPEPGKDPLEMGQPVMITAGGVTRANLGGMGRPVVGRFFATGDPGEDFDWSRCRALLSASDAPHPPDLSVNPFFHQDNRKYQRVDVGPDGSFRIEDVMAGEYRIAIQVYRLFKKGEGAAAEWVAEWATEKKPYAFVSHIGYAGTQITVPPVAQGYSDEPLDAGLIEVYMPSTQKNGPAPAPGRPALPEPRKVTGMVETSAGKPTEGAEVIVLNDRFAVTLQASGREAGLGSVRQ